MRTTSRPHCTCTEVRNLSIEAAAERLGCRERLLRDNLSRITHQKYGDVRVFCPCELRLAMRHFTVLADAEDAAAMDAGSNVTELHPEDDPLRRIRPAQGRKTTSR